MIKPVQHILEPGQSKQEVSRYADPVKLQMFKSVNEVQKEIDEINKAGDIVSHILVGKLLYEEIKREFVPHIPPGKRIKNIGIDGCVIYIGVNCGDWQYSIEKIEMNKLRTN